MRIRSSAPSITSIRPLLIGVGLGFAMLTAHAQVATYTAPDAVVGPGEIAALEIALDTSTFGASIGGSFCLCFDPLGFDLVGVTEGSDLQALNGGAGATFFAVTSAADRACVSWITGSGIPPQIPPSPDLRLAVLELQALGGVGLVSPLIFCTTAQPVVVNMVVLPSSVQVAAITEDGSLTISAEYGSYSLVVPETVGFGEVLAATVELDATAPVEGFRFGLVSEASFVAQVAAVPSPALSATNGGAGPDFLSIDLGAAGGSGITVDGTISTVAPFETLPAGTSSLLEISYLAAAGPGALCGPTRIEFSDLLGVPIETTTAAGNSIANAHGSTVQILPDALTAPSGAVVLTVETVDGERESVAEVPVRLDHAGAVQAFSFGVGHDNPSIPLIAIEPGAAIDPAQCGLEVDFFSGIIDGDGSLGGIVLAVMTIDPNDPNVSLLPAGNHEIALLRYSISTGSVGGASIEITDQVGSLSMAVEVTIDQGGVSPITVPGAVVVDASFVRQECNGDGGVNIADAIYLLGHLFPIPGIILAPIDCDDACDSNDDDSLNIADAIHLLQSLFGSAVVAEPLSCGLDPVPEDGLGCDASSCP